MPVSADLLGPRALFSAIRDALGLDAPDRDEVPSRTPTDAVVTVTRSRHDLRAQGMSPSEFEAFQLWTFGEAGIPTVSLRAPRSGPVPAVCAATHGETMSLDEAMRWQPIPHAVSEGEVCRCTYRPVPHATSVARA